MNPIKIAILATCACTMPSRSGSGRTPSPAVSPVEVVDLTPRFLAFYDSATVLHADADERWNLWRSLYHFAAVPPTPFGDSLARRLLDSSWARYASALPVIRRGAVGLGISADTALQRVVGILQCGDTVRVRLTVFVGGFEANAFAFGVRDGKANIAIPVEAGIPSRSIIHEMTHAVHRGGCARFATGYGQSLAELVITEGLAMRVVQHVLPDHDAAFYLTATPAWFRDAQSRHTQLLEGIIAHLSDSGSEAVQRFTFGTGTTGLSREAYYAGWALVGLMVDRLRMSLHDIAVADPATYPDLIRRTMQAARGKA